MGYSLTSKNDLGCHTEVMSDSIMALMKAGVINNSRPKFIPGKTVVGFAFGSKALYEYLDHNEDLYFAPLPGDQQPGEHCQERQHDLHQHRHVHRPLRPGGRRGMGLHQFSGTGGQGDYVRGAQLAKGASPSWPSSPPWAPTRTAPQEPDHALLPPATIVTTPRSDVQYVVTEYGVVNLKTLTARDRTRALISLAHPDCRSDLTAQAIKMGIL